MRPYLPHLIVLLVVVIIVFGANRLPDIARNLGKSMKIMKEEVKDLRDDDAPPDGTSPSDPKPGSTL